MTSILGGVNHSDVIGYPQALREHYRGEGAWGGQPLNQELQSAMRRHHELPAMPPLPISCISPDTSSRECSPEIWGNGHPRSRQSDFLASS